MNKRRGCSRRIVVTLSVLGALACVVLGVSALLYYRLHQARAQNEPPSVTITEPAEGASTLAGSNMVVAAMAFGGIPITRAELWVDGELVDTEETSMVGGISPFYASFDLLVSQGLHSLFVRAVNAAGLIGDSWPVGIGGVEFPGPDEPARLVTVGADETLEDIAATYDVNPETVRQLNPDLGGQQPPAGSTVVLPPPQSQAPEGPGGPPSGPTTPGGPSVGPTIPPGGPAVTVTVPSPSGPPLGIFKPIPLLPGLLGLLSDLKAPAAPTNLIAEVTGCQVRLRWNDNANNEDRYEVWYTWNIWQAPRLIAKLNPAKGGQVWYEFDMGYGAYIFWVEAVNGVGRQKSNPAAAKVTLLTCSQTLATQLQVEALDMTVPAGYNNLYCYVSFEGAQHVPVPAGTNNFIQVTGGKGNIGAWATGNNKLVVAIPADESLEITGHCLGYKGCQPGGSCLPEIIGNADFAGKYPRATWDGTRRPLAGPGFEIGLSIKPLGAALDTSGLLTTYSYEDPTIPVPYQVVEHKLYSPWPIDPLLRSLSWKWDGDSNKIAGFQILLNGAPYSPGGWSLVAPQSRELGVRLPRGCGMHILWQVRAVAVQALSKLSAQAKENDYDLPKCGEHAMVKFNNVRFIDECDDLDLYWFLRLNGVTKTFGYGCTPGFGSGCNWNGWSLHNCGPHSFATLGQGENAVPDAIVIPIPEVGPISVKFEADMYDTMDWNGDDLEGHFMVLYEFSSLQDAQQRVRCGREICVGPNVPDLNAQASEASKASFCYGLYIFPQPEGLNCLVKEPVYKP